MTAALTATATNPFVGPRSFRTGEPIFGRVRETRRIVDLLVAERIVLLYSPSGAGKTSLINAALVPALRDERFQVSPPLRVGLGTGALAPELAGHNRYVLSVLQSLEQRLPLEQQRDLHALARLGLEGYLAEWAGDDGFGAGNELLVFDQFEEILTDDPSDESGRRAFFTELGRALRDRGRWALFAMREDYLAGLDPYVALLPTKLRTRVRLDLLDAAGATAAIQEPARRAGRSFTEAAAERLVDELRLMHVERGSERVQVPGPFVEPVQLQVVCHRIWESLGPEVAQIDVEHVATCGDVERALADFYARAVGEVAARTGTSERLVREWFDEDLITASGFRTQVPHGPRGLGDAQARVLAMLEDTHVIRAERRRGTRWVELSHDRLVEPVRSDNARWRLQHLSDLQRQAAAWHAEGRREGLLLTGAPMDEAAWWVQHNREALTDVDRSFWQACLAARDARRQRRRVRWITVIAAVLSLALLGAFLAVQVVVDSAREAESRAQALQSLALHERDPLQAVTTALAALDEARTPEAEQALRRGMAALRVTAEWQNSGQGAQSAEFSRDGTRVLTAGTDRTARLRDVEDGRELGTYSHDSERFLDERIHRVATSTDGGRLLTVAYDQARLWDVTGTLLVDVSAPDDSYITAGDMSADGRRIVTAVRTGAVTVQEAAPPGDVPPTPTVIDGHPDGTFFAVFGPDGATVLTAGAEQTGEAVRIWSSTTGEQLGVLPVAHEIRTVAFSPAGDVVGVGDREGGLHLWRWRAGTAPVVVDDHTDPVASLDFDTEGDRVVTAAGKQLRVFRTSDGAPLVDATGHTDLISSVSFDPRGERLLSASYDGSALVWDATSGTRVDALMGHTDGILAAQFDADGRRVVTTSEDGTTRLWEPLADLTVMSAGEPQGFMHAARYSADGRYVVGAEHVGRVHVWDASTGERLQELDASEDRLTAAAFDGGGTRVLVTSDRDVSMWDWRAGKELARRPGALVRAALSPDGSVVATSDPMRPWDVHLWTWADPEDVELVLKGHDFEVGTAQFSADGRWLATGGADDTVRVWDVETGEQQALLEAHEGDVTSVAFSPDGRRLVSVSGEAAWLWDWAEERPLRVLPAAEQRLSTAAFSADGERVITGDVAGTTGVWDAGTGHRLAWFERHTEYVNTVTTSPEGDRILTASDDGTVRAYECDVCLPLDDLIEQAERRVAEVR